MFKKIAALATAEYFEMNSADGLTVEPVKPLK